MRLPPVQIVSQSEYFVSGDVSIHETAVVAPGVVLQAAPNSQILIGEGSCIGMGTVINAYAGIVDIESGVTLGPGVLIIGRVTIGHGTCVGTTTTIINTSIEPLTMVAPGSLLGDTSRAWQPETVSPPSEIPSPWDTEEGVGDSLPVPESSVEIEPEPELPSEPAIATEFVAAVDTALKEKQPVVGQVYINQLLITLFPERQTFKRNNPGSS
jgi:carbon dioxide concentrating mechanism protein CcmN